MNFAYRQLTSHGKALPTINAAGWCKERLLRVYISISESFKINGAYAYVEKLTWDSHAIAGMKPTVRSF